MAGQRVQAVHVVHRVTGVRHLDAVEALRDEGLDALPGAVATGMGPDGDATRVVNQAGRIGDLEARFLDIRRLFGAEPSIERVPQISAPATGDEGARDVWATDGSRPGLGHDGFHRDRDSPFVERRHDRLRSRDAIRLEPGQRRVDPGHIREMQAEDVNLDIAVVDGAELNASDDRDTIRRARGRGGGYARDGVVVGDGHGLEADGGGMGE